LLFVICYFRASRSEEEYLVLVLTLLLTFGRKCGSFFHHDSGSKYVTSPANLGATSNKTECLVIIAKSNGQLRDTICDFSTYWISCFIELDFEILSLLVIVIRLVKTNGEDYTKRLELLLRKVLAFPNASRSGLEDKITCFTYSTFSDLPLTHEISALGQANLLKVDRK
jgi:hypothetical protein